MPVIIDEIVSRHLPPAAHGQPRVGPVQLTPEQVRQVAERVYALLLEDLRIEAERSRAAVRRGGVLKGGRY